MQQIIIQGRGGQGAQMAGNLLAAAFFAAGRQVQCFATYGGARRGTPVSSFIRVDDRPVFSVQYHPEASPGPQDSFYLFERFAEAMANRAAR